MLLLALTDAVAAGFLAFAHFTCMKLVLIKVRWRSPEVLNHQAVKSLLEGLGIIFMNGDAPKYERRTPAVCPRLVNEKQVHEPLLRGVDTKRGPA